MKLKLGNGIRKQIATEAINCTFLLILILINFEFVLPLPTKLINTVQITNEIQTLLHVALYFRLVPKLKRFQFGLDHLG